MQTSATELLKLAQQVLESRNVTDMSSLIASELTRMYGVESVVWMISPRAAAPTILELKAAELTTLTHDSLAAVDLVQIDPESKLNAGTPLLLINDSSIGHTDSSLPEGYSAALLPVTVRGQLIVVLGLFTKSTHSLEIDLKNVVSNISAYNIVPAVGLAWHLRALELNSRLEEAIEARKKYERAESLAVLGLMYGETLHLYANKLGAARQWARNIQTRSSNLEAAKDEAVKIERNISQVLTASREIREAVDPPSSFDIHAMLSGFTEQVNRTYSGNIVVVRNYRLSSPMITGYQHQTQQVLRIVIHNACDAMNGAGTLTIGTRIHRDNNDLTLVRIEVTDTGSGIPADQIEALFELGRSKKLRTSRRGYGTGLAWSKLFLQMIGGGIDIQSEQGAGTTVTIDVPRGSVLDRVNAFG